MSHMKGRVISALVGVLLAGSTFGVSARDEPEEPISASPFAWTIVDVLEGGSLVVEAQDPRASGVITSGEPAAHVDGQSDGASLAAGYDTARLTNDGGVWIGQRTHLSLDRSTEPSLHQLLDVWQFSGAEGYDGLELRLVDEGLDGNGSFAWGVIFPTDFATVAK